MSPREARVHQSTTKMKRVSNQEFEDLIESIEPKRSKEDDDFATLARKRLKEHSLSRVPYPSCILPTEVDKDRDGLIKSIEHLVLEQGRTKVRLYDGEDCNLLENALGCTFWTNAYAWSTSVRSKTEEDEKRYHAYVDRIMCVIETLWDAEHPSTKCVVDEDGWMTVKIPKK